MMNEKSSLIESCHSIQLFAPLMRSFHRRCRRRRLWSSRFCNNLLKREKDEPKRAHEKIGADLERSSRKAAGILHLLNGGPRQQLVFLFGPARAEPMAAKKRAGNSLLSLSVSQSGCLPACPARVRL